MKHIENFTGFVNESYIAGAEAFVENMKHALEDELVMSFSIFSSAKQLENGTLCIYITDETIDLLMSEMGLDKYHYKVPVKDFLKGPHSSPNREFIFYFSSKKMKNAKGSHYFPADLNDPKSTAQYFKKHLCDCIKKDCERAFDIHNKANKYTVSSAFPMFSPEDYTPYFKFVESNSTALKRFSWSDPVKASVAFPFAITALLLAVLENSSMGIPVGFDGSYEWIFSDLHGLDTKSAERELCFKMQDTVRFIEGNFVRKIQIGLKKFPHSNSDNRLVFFTKKTKFLPEEMNVPSFVCEFLTRAVKGEVSVEEFEKIVHDKRGMIAKGKFRF